MRYGSQVRKMRRFLRDPDARIWESVYLMTVYNDIQREVQHITGFLENVEAIRLPPSYHYSYMFDWEYPHLEGDRFYQCLNLYQQGGYAFCNRWEVQTSNGTDGTAEEDGAHFTHPFEAWYMTCGDVVKYKFPPDFFKAKYVAYDLKPIYPIEKKAAMQSSDYKTREGEPFAYYRDDNLNDDFVLFPKPSSVTVEDIIEQPNYLNVYSQSWESDYVEGEQFTRDADPAYLYFWETGDYSGEDYGLRGMFLFEAGVSLAGQYGMVLYRDDYEPFGTIISGDYMNQDEGIAVDIVDAENNILLIYDAMAREMQDESDESDYPEFMQKYLECGTLERAYSANTDGRIGSLRDYWGYRYQIGIMMLKKHMHKRKSDRNYRLTTSRTPPNRNFRHPRLPDAYPAV